MIEQCIQFIQEKTLIPCSIDRSIQKGHPCAMWNGIALIQGSLYVNPDIAHAGDLLHEAGHVVTVPLVLRKFVTGELGSDLSLMEKFYELGAKFDPPRSFTCDDTATYWGICALQSMGLGIRKMFENGYTTEFRGEERDREIEDYVLISSQSRSRFSVSAHYCGLLDSNPRAYSGGNPMIDRWDIGLS